MSSNVDILVANQIAQMYSEREYDWANTEAERMFTEVDDDNN